MWKKSIFWFWFVLPPYGGTMNHHRRHDKSLILSMKVHICAEIMVWVILKISWKQEKSNTRFKGIHLHYIYYTHSAQIIQKKKKKRKKEKNHSCKITYQLNGVYTYKISIYTYNNNYIIIILYLYSASSVKYAQSALHGIYKQNINHSKN